MTSVKYLVYKDMFFLMQTTYPYISCPSNWNGLVKLVETCFHDIKITPILWNRPPTQWCKLNLYGSALSDGRIGGWGNC